MVIRTGGFVAWFEGIIYNKMRDACKNIYIKLFVHSFGLLTMVLGIYFFLGAIPSFKSIVGLILIFIGLVIFLTPFGIDKVK